MVWAVTGSMDLDLHYPRYQALSSSGRVKPDSTRFQGEVCGRCGRPGPVIWRRSRVKGSQALLRLNAIKPGNEARPTLAGTGMGPQCLMLLPPPSYFQHCQQPHSAKSGSVADNNINKTVQPFSFFQSNRANFKVPLSTTKCTSKGPKTIAKGPQHSVPITLN